MIAKPLDLIIVYDLWLPVGHLIAWRYCTRKSRDQMTLNDRILYLWMVVCMYSGTIYIYIYMCVCVCVCVWKSWSTSSQILTIRLIIERVHTKNLVITLLLVILTNAFDTIHIIWSHQINCSCSNYAQQKHKCNGSRIRWWHWFLQSNTSVSKADVWNATKLSRRSHLHGYQQVVVPLFVSPRFGHLYHHSSYGSMSVALRLKFRLEFRW